MTPENGKNDTKYDEKIQNSRLPVGFLISYLGDFFVGIVKLHECTDFRYMYVKRSSRQHSAEYL